MEIGEYIHLKYQNYIKYGLSHNSDASGVEGQAAKSFEAQRRLMTQSAISTTSAGACLALEQQLNFFYRQPGVAIMGYSAAEADKIQNFIINLCKQAAQQLKIDIANVDWNSLFAGGYGGVTQRNSDLRNELAKVRQYKLGSGAKEQGTATTREAVERRIQLLRQLEQELIWNSPNNLTAVDQSFLTKMQSLLNKYNTLKKTWGTSNQFKITNIDFINDLNEMVSMTKVQTDKNIAGALGEMVPVIVQTVFEQVYSQGLQNLNLSSLTNIVNSQITGGSNSRMVGNVRSHKGIYEGNVIKKAFDYKQEISIGDIALGIGATQDKVDIKVQLPGQEQLTNASVKNINQYAKDIDILSGTSILKRLQGYSYFANHYLNISATHADSNASSHLIQAAHDAMKLTVAVHALIGGELGTYADGSVRRGDRAQLFIVNESGGSVGNWKVRDMSDIIYSISNNLDLITIKGLEDPQRWNNIQVGTSLNRRAGYKRISNLLSELHAFNLQVSIDKQALQ